MIRRIFPSFVWGICTKNGLDFFSPFVWFLFSLIFQLVNLPCASLWYTRSLINQLVHQVIYYLPVFPRKLFSLYMYCQCESCSVGTPVYWSAYWNQRSVSVHFMLQQLNRWSMIFMFSAFWWICCIWGKHHLPCLLDCKKDCIFGCSPQAWKRRHGTWRLCVSHGLGGSPTTAIVRVTAE